MLPTDLMKNDQLLAQISEYCRQAGMAESTFGRRAVNDGKLVHRLREGKRITVDTLERIRGFLGDGALIITVPEPPIERRDPTGNFRFFENRQKYLLFVHTCGEKAGDRRASGAGIGKHSPAAAGIARVRRSAWETGRCWRA